MRALLQNLTDYLRLRISQMMCYEMIPTRNEARTSSFLLHNNIIRRNLAREWLARGTRTRLRCPGAEVPLLRTSTYLTGLVGTTLYADADNVRYEVTPSGGSLGTTQL